MHSAYILFNCIYFLYNKIKIIKIYKTFEISFIWFYKGFILLFHKLYYLFIVHTVYILFNIYCLV